MEEKLKEYFRIIGDLSRVDTFQDNWINLLDPFLEKATRCCRGEVTYCIHKISGDTVHFEHGGPATYIVHRENTENSSVSTGLIGQTIRNKKTFEIYPNVHIEECRNIYIQGNARTSSELVVVMPNPSSSQPIGVINIESNLEDAFDNIDGIGFSLIGLWASLLKTYATQREKTKEVLTQVTSDFTNIQAFPQKDRKKRVVFDSLAKLTSSIISPDALAIVSISQTNRQLSVSNPLYRYEYRKGYSHSTRSENTIDERNSFPAHVIRNHMNRMSHTKETTVVEFDVDLTLDRFGLKEIRPTTVYAIGIGFSYELSQDSKFGALILEFDKVPKYDQFMLGNLQLLTYAQIALLQQIDLINEREILRKAIKGLSIINDIASSNQTLRDFLSKAPEQISEDIRASGCAFYEIERFDDVNAYNRSHEQHDFLRELGYFGDNKRSNVFWRNRFNKEWITNLSEVFSGGRAKEFFIDIPSSEENRVIQYTVFVQPVKVPNKRVLFISFKKIEAHHNSLRISETSRDIISAHLSAVERIVEEKLREVTNGFQRDGLTQAVRMWLESVAKKSDSGEEDTQHQLFLAVHEFLLNWKPTETPLSAIYLLEENGKDRTLVMTKSTLNHLNEKGTQLNAISEPLKFDVSSHLPISRHGLTQKVLTDVKSILSFNVTRQGNPQCREFWDAVSDTPAEQRWFAGAPIIHTANSEPHRYGVLTINGLQPLNLFEQLQTGQSILPVIEIVAKELGDQLHKLEHKVVR